MKSIVIVAFLAGVACAQPFRVGSGVQIKPRTTAPTPIVTGNGRVWVKSNDSNKLYYTNPAGTSIALGSGGSGTLPDAYSAGGANGGQLTLDATGNEFNLNYPAIGTTLTTGFRLRQSTAAGAGAQKYSPIYWLEGQGWKTDATAGSQKVEIGYYLRTIQGAAAPSGEFVYVARVNSGSTLETGRAGYGYSYGPGGNSYTLSSHDHTGSYTSLGMLGGTLRIIPEGTNPTHFLDLNSTKLVSGIDLDYDLGDSTHHFKYIYAQDTKIDATAGSNGDVMTLNSGVWAAAAAPAGGGITFVDAAEKPVTAQSVKGNNTFNDIGGIADWTTVSTSAADHVVGWCLNGLWTGSWAEGEFRVDIDGSVPTQTAGKTAISVANGVATVCRRFKATLSSGTHTIKLQWRTTALSSGSMALNSTGDAPPGGGSLYWTLEK